MKSWLPFLLIAWRAFASDSDQLDLHAQRAKAAQEHGDFQRAAAEWEAIVKIRPDLAEAHSNLGMMWHLARDFPSAIAAFQEALRLNPKLTAPHLFLGIDYYLTSRPGKAIPELRAAATLDPHNPLARKWLAMSYLQLESFPDAVRELELAISRDPSDSELLFWLSRTYSKILYQSYSRIRELAPDSEFLQRLREDSAEAFDFEVDLRSPPLQTEDWYRRGATAKIRGLKALDTYLTRSPESYRIHQLQAEYAMAQGDDKRAMEQYRKALSASPAAVQLHLAIGNIYVSHHEYAEAIPEYEAELQSDPYSLSALERIGEAYAALQEPAHAEGFLKRAIAIDPQAFEALRTLGKVCFEQGDYKCAVANYREAVSSGPHPPATVLFQLSKAYRKLGNSAEADRWLERFQQALDQEHNDLQHRLQNARQP